jgi:putative ABC transport system substrate-binding protein
MILESRRRFLQAGLVLAGLGWLTGCTAPPPTRVYRVGVLSQESLDGSPYFEALRQGLREHGYVEGHNLTLETRSTDARDQVIARTLELVDLGAEVIVVLWGGAVGARNATSTTPIVFTTVADPFAGSRPLAISLAKPEGNATGLTIMAAGLGAKRLEILKELAPGISHVAVVTNVEVNDKGGAMLEMSRAGQTLGLRVQVLPVRSPGDLDGTFQTIRRSGADALFVYGDLLTLRERARIAEFAASARLPSLYEFREFAEAGGLAAYGPNVVDLCRRAGSYVDRILKGARPADLPIEQPTRFDFVVNLKTAQTLGLSVSDSILQQATEVIQ